MGKFITPSSLPPTKYCRRLLIPNSPEWIGAITGALYPLTFASEWEQITGISAEDAAAAAQVMFYDYLDSHCGDDPMENCCVEVYFITRVNPDTGMVEVSYDNGVTWTPKPGQVGSLITKPIPPVTSGLVGNKCDAATNAMTQIQGWIDHTSGDFDIAVTVIEFGFLVAAAIANAVLLLLSEGALTVAETEILGVIASAVGAIWAEGKTLFDGYWTDDVKHSILCALNCTIGADGSFNDAQFAALYAKLGTDLPPGAAKVLFRAFLSSVGASGVSAMAASGTAHDSDCSDCGCSECCDCDNGSEVFGTWAFDPPSSGVTLAGQTADFPPYVTLNHNAITINLGQNICIPALEISEAWFSPSSTWRVTIDGQTVLTGNPGGFGGGVPNPNRHYDLECPTPGQIIKIYGVVDGVIVKDITVYKCSDAP